MEGLRRNDSDTAIIALIAMNRFLLPSYDPWLLARKAKSIYDVNTKGNITIYLPDSPARSMGCTIQVCSNPPGRPHTNDIKHQFCVKNASGDHCSRLDSLPTRLNTTEWHGASPVQLSALKLLIDANEIGLTDHKDPVFKDFLDSAGLISIQVPSDQWIVEARTMESFVWASMQVVIGDYAIGPSARNSALANATVKPETNGDKILCGSMKMRKAGGFV
jgi:hypothetical protein